MVTMIVVCACCRGAALTMMSLSGLVLSCRDLFLFRLRSKVGDCLPVCLLIMVGGSPTACSSRAVLPAPASTTYHPRTYTILNSSPAPLCTTLQTHPPPKLLTSPPSCYIHPLSSHLALPLGHFTSLRTEILTSAPESWRAIYFLFISMYLLLPQPCRPNKV